MPKIRHTTQIDIHQHISRQTMSWSTLVKGTWKEYVSRFGLHHVTKTDGSEGLLKACLNIEFMAHYIQVWVAFTQPLKLCRIIGMSRYVDGLVERLNNITPSQDNLEHLILVNIFLVVSQEPSEEVVALSEQLYAMTNGIELGHMSLIRLHRCMGLLYRKINRFDDAQTHLQRAIQIGQDHHLLLHPDCMEARTELSLLVQRTGNFEDGLKLMEAVYKDSLEQYGPHFELTLATRTSLAWYAHQMGKLNDAERQYKDVLSEIEEAHGKSHILYLNAMIELADTTKMKGDTQEAFDLLNDLQQHIRNELGPRTFTYIQVSNNLALCSLELGFYDKAKDIFLELIGYTKNQAVPIPMYFINIAVVCMHQENIEEAEEYMAEANRLAQIHWPEKCADFLILKQNMARLKMHQEDYIEAIIITKEVLELQIDLHGDSHFAVTIAYASLAYLYNCIDNTEQSVRYNKLTYDSGIHSLGKTHQYVSNALYEVAYHYESQEEYDEMEHILEDGCAPLLENLEPITSSTVYNLFLLGRAKFALEKYSEAIDLYNTLLTYEQGVYGTDHIELATTHYYLAQCYMKNDSVQDAIVHRNKCFALEQAENGTEHPDTISVGLHLVKDLHKGGQIDDALNLHNRLKEAIQNLEEPDDDLMEKWNTADQTLFL